MELLTHSTDQKIFTELRAANHSFKEKKDKYDQTAHSSNLGFIPIIFEITGRMHPETYSFFHDLLKKTAVDMLAPFDALWKYWISSLMICIQRKLVHGIRDRCFNIYGRNFDETYESNFDTIVEIDHLRV